MPKLFKIPYNLLCEKCQKSRYFCGRILARISRSRKVSEVFHVCMSVDSKLQFTHASSSSHSWLSMQPQQVQSSKLMVTSLSCAELGTAQLQLVQYISRVFQGCFSDLRNFFQAKFFLDSFLAPKFFSPEIFFTLNLIWMQFFEFFGNKVFVYLVFKRRKMLWDPKFSGQYFWTKYFYPHFFYLNFFDILFQDQGYKALCRNVWRITTFINISQVS